MLERHDWCQNCGKTLPFPHQRKIVGADVIKFNSLYYLIVKSICPECGYEGYSQSIESTKRTYLISQRDKIRESIKHE